MASPLFLSSLQDAQTKLRLSSIKNDSDAYAVLKESCRKTRLDLFTSLGQSTIDKIKLTATTEEPSTAEQYTRILANKLEVTRMRWYLLFDLPIQITKSSSERAIWNEEGIIRTPTNELDSLRDRLLKEWTAGIRQLISGTLSSESIFVTSIEPESPKPKLGGSVGLVPSRIVYDD